MTLTPPATGRELPGKTPPTLPGKGTSSWVDLLDIPDMDTLIGRPPYIIRTKRPTVLRIMPYRISLDMGTSLRTGTHFMVDTPPAVDTPPRLRTPPRGDTPPRVGTHPVETTPMRSVHTLAYAPPPPPALPTRCTCTHTLVLALHGNAYVARTEATRGQ